MFPEKAVLIKCVVVMSHRVFTASDETQLWGQAAAFIKGETCFFQDNDA